MNAEQEEAKDAISAELDLGRRNMEAVIVVNRASADLMVARATYWRCLAIGVLCAAAGLLYVAVSWR